CLRRHRRDAGRRPHPDGPHPCGGPGLVRRPRPRGLPRGLRRRRHRSPQRPLHPLRRAQQLPAAARRRPAVSPAPPTERPTHSAAALAALLEQPPPTEAQTAVTEAPLAPMLVVAGAGSGKTETRASRVVWLIANGIVEPRQVLGLTFTRKAAHELTERIGARLGALAAALRAEGLAPPRGLERGGDDLVGQRPLVHTYNGFALDLVREHAL